MKKAQKEENSSSNKEQEYLIGWKRARAELLNLRARMDRERVADRKRLQAQSIEPLLEVADHLQALIDHVPEDIKDHAWVQGVLHIARKFEQVLAEQGVEVVNPENQVFDPSAHEAVEQVEGEGENTVVSVVQVGYRLGDTILRPAKVKVTK